MNDITTSRTDAYQVRATDVDDEGYFVHSRWSSLTSSIVYVVSTFFRCLAWFERWWNFDGWRVDRLFRLKETNLLVFSCRMRKKAKCCIYLKIL